MRINGLKNLLLSAALALPVAACGGADTPAETAPAADTAEAETTPAEHAGHDSGRMVGEHGDMKQAHEHGAAEHGGPAKEHEHDFPGAVNAYHEVLAPVWHSDAKDPCGGEAEQMLAEARNITTMEIPEGVAGDAWSTAGQTLLEQTQQLVETCESAPAEAPAKMEGVHDAFHGVVALIGHQD